MIYIIDVFIVTMFVTKAEYNAVTGNQKLEGTLSYIVQVVHLRSCKIHKTFLIASVVIYGPILPEGI